MGILDIFKKELEFTAALNIDKRGNFQLVELKMINTSHFPHFTNIGVLENFSKDGIFRKKSFIEKFKILREKIQSEKLFLNSFENKKLENEIKSALKISGFSDISVVPKKNIEGIILPANSHFQQMSVHFSGNKIAFITTENDEITKKEILKLSDFKVSTVSKITKHLEQKHIFLSGAKPEILEPIIGVFYQAGIKVHIQNIWENFLEFSDGIPELFPEESHNFISALSLCVPNLKKWEYKVLENKQKSNIQKEKSILKSETVFLPKTKKKTYLKKPAPQKTKKIEKKSSKNIHKIKTKSTTKNKKPSPILKSVKSLDYDLKNPKKTYLPKKSKKVFLPKPKKSGIWKKVKSILNSEI